MSHLGRTLRNTALPALLLAGLGVAVYVLGEPYQVRVAYMFFVNLVVVVGLQVFMGNANVAHLGHVSFMGIAAYAVAILTTPVAIKATLIPGAPLGLATFALPIAPAIVIALAVTLLIAWLSGLALTRLSGVAATIGTLALLVVVHVIFINWIDLFRGPRAFYGIPIASSLPWAVAASVAAVFVAKLFRDSKDGVQLRASSDNMVAARSMGVEVERLRLKAWLLSGLVIGAGGILQALFVGTISPASFYFHATFLTLAMLILGGMRSVSGAVVGTFVVSAGFEITRTLENGPVVLGIDLPEMFGLTGFFLGAVIVLSMTLRPDGIMGDDEVEDVLAGRRRAAAEGEELKALKEAE